MKMDSQKTILLLLVALSLPFVIAGEAQATDPNWGYLRIDVRLEGKQLNHSLHNSP